MPIGHGEILWWGYEDVKDVAIDPLFLHAVIETDKLSVPLTHNQFYFCFVYYTLYHRDASFIVNHSLIKHHL